MSFDAPLPAFGLPPFIQSIPCPKSGMATAGVHGVAFDEYDAAAAAAAAAAPAAASGKKPRAAGGADRRFLYAANDWDAGLTQFDLLHQLKGGTATPPLKQFKSADRLRNLSSICVGKDGMIYVAESGTRIQILTPAGEIDDTIQIALSEPPCIGGLAIDEQRNELYVSAGVDGVLVLDLATGEEKYRLRSTNSVNVKPAAGSPPPMQCCGIAVHNDALYVVDAAAVAYNNAVASAKASSSSSSSSSSSGELAHSILVFRLPANPEEIPAVEARVQKHSFGELRSAGTKGTLERPIGIAVDGLNRVWVSEFSASRISVFTNSGSYLGSFGSLGNGEHEFQYPRDLAISEDGRTLAVADKKNDRIQLFDVSVSKSISEDPRTCRNCEACVIQ